jgi:two-component system alkaline phosphatase synthesis response regulator PhoP
MPQKILIVDDEKDIVELVKYNLVKEGYIVITARTGKQALEQALQQPNLVLLDIMMPEYDGLEVLKQLKKNEKTNHIPVIFLTAKGTDIDEVLGLELGADDYIVKPISIPKLLARVKNVLRKQEEGGKPSAQSIVIGAIEIHPARHIVLVNKKEMFFPKKEFEVLLFLARHSGEVVGREVLLNNVWGSDVQVVDRTVDVHIRKIREKLDRCADYIETIKGVGYRLREQ